MSYPNKGERNDKRGPRWRAQDGRTPGKWHFIKQWKREETGQMISPRARGQACLILSPQIKIPHSPACRLGSHHEMVVKAGGFYCSNSDVGKWRKLTPSAEELQTIWLRVLTQRRIRAISRVLPAPHSPALFSLLEQLAEQKPLTENACQTRPWANVCQLPSQPGQHSDSHLWPLPWFHFYFSFFEGEKKGTHIKFSYCNSWKSFWSQRILTVKSKNKHWEISCSSGSTANAWGFNLLLPELLRGKRRPGSESRNKALLTTTAWQLETRPRGRVAAVWVQKNSLQIQGSSLHWGLQQGS